MSNPKNNYNGTKIEFQVNTTCHLCQNQYKTVSNLNRHIRNKHHTEPTEHARKRMNPKVTLDNIAPDAPANTTNPISLTPPPSTLPPSTPPPTPPDSTTSIVDDPITLARDS